MPIGLVYARESFRKDDLPIERQIETGKAAVLARQLTPEIFIEPPGHRSGRSDKHRPQWRALKKRFADPDVQLLWVNDISRATRSKIEFFQLLSELKGHNVQLISHRENFDTTTAAGRAMMGVVAVMNEWFAEDIAERRNVQIAYMRAHRIYLGRPPQGLKAVGKGLDRRMVPDEDTSYRVNGTARTGLDLVQAWLELLTGPDPVGTYRGAALLNQRGYRVIGNNRQAHPVRPFDLQNINRSVYHPKRPDALSAYAGVLPDPLLTRARERLRDISHHKRGGGRRKLPPPLLRGLVYCDYCGKPYWSGYGIIKRPHKTYRYPIYRHTQCCHTACIGTAQIDRVVLDRLAPVRALRDDQVQRYARRAAAPQADPHADRRAFLQAKLLRLEKYLVEGMISETTYRTEHPAVERELAQLPPLPARSLGTVEEYAAWIRALARTLRVVEQMHPEVANGAMRDVVYRVHVRDRAVEIDWQPEFARLLANVK